MGGLLFVLLLAGCGDDAGGGDAGPGVDAGPGTDGAPPGDAAPGRDGASADADTAACAPGEIGGGFFGGAPEAGVTIDLRACSPDTGTARYSFRGVYFALGWDGETYVADRAEQIEYTNSHHQWYDAAVATLADRRLHWWMTTDSPDFVSRYFVRAEALDGTVLLAETEVH